MKAQTIINRASIKSAVHSKDQVTRLCFNVGVLESEVKSLCRELAQFTAVNGGTETTFEHAGCKLAVFYEVDEEGYFYVFGVYANGMNVHELLSEDVMDLIYERVTDHAYIQRKQAEYDRAEQQMEARRDADLEGGAV
jgi:ribosomal protein S6